MLSYLLWRIHNYPSPPVTIEINQESYKVIRGWQNFGDSDSLWNLLSKKNRIHIEDALEQVNYWKWKRFYHDPDILDGTTWSIKVRGGKNGGRRKNCEGVNSFPPGWRKVETVIMKLANLKK